MQVQGGGGDIDRALSSIRARADHLRHTIVRLEHNLAWNPASTWCVAPVARKSAANCANSATNARVTD